MRWLLIICGITIISIALAIIAHALFNEYEVNHLRNMIQKGDAVMVSELIKRDPQLLSADLGGRHGDNLKALSLAAGLGKEIICSNLIRLGAGVNEKDKYMYTPLHCAAMADQENVVTLLLQMGGDPTIRDFQGLTPLDLARRYNSSSNLIVRLLVESTNKGVTNIGTDQQNKH